MRKCIALLLILICLTCSACAAPAESAIGVRLAALNVGKGDCLLLMLDGRSYLIDSGYEYTWNLLREALQQYGITRLDGVILTHCDKDHSGGLMPLAQSDIEVGAWYASEFYYDVKENQHPLMLAAAERGDTVHWLSAGDAFDLSESASLLAVGPLTLNETNENNNSLVFYVDTDEGTLLFTGDMKLEEEFELLKAGMIGPADLLKVPFHGDNTASSQSFVEAVMPRAALICTSTAQEPDTPAPSVIKRYARAGAEVYVTQEYAQGVELTLRSGEVTARGLDWELPDYSKYLRASIDVENDLLTLYNSSAENIPLAGWIVYSSKGRECMTMPENTLLPANGVFKLGTRASGDGAILRLDIKRLWHKSKYDQAMIFDSTGGLAAVTDNGMPE